MKPEFSFLYPTVLLLLIIIPALAWWFLMQQKQYWHDAFAFSQISLLKNLKHLHHQVFQQRMLPLLLLLALTFGVIGMAQPVLKTRVATQNTYLMLVLDISISMEAKDLTPNRLEAAKAAAIEFTRDLPQGVKVGLEFFAGNNYMVTPPIEDHDLVVEYLKSLKLEDLRPGTAIGDAMLTALESLRATINAATPSNLKIGKQPQGSIILLTDGESNLGISPQAAVDEAVKQGVSTYTVGMGEETGAYVRGGIFTHLDESTLQSIAQQTGGDYYRARSFNDFKDIYRKIGQKTLGSEEKEVSLMPWCLGLSSLFILASFFWGVHYRRF